MKKGTKNDDYSINLTLLTKSDLNVEGFFGYESDYIGRIFGNYVYTIDSHSYNLHVFSIRDKQWNYSSL